jgi:hypothetical protein
MCFNKGPLVSPQFVKKHMVLRYRKVASLLRENRVEALILDCDGTIDKRALAKGKKEIDEELAKVRELLEYGGYFPNVDHHIPSDVPRANIRYLIEQIKRIR